MPLRLWKWRNNWIVNSFWYLEDWAGAMHHIIFINAWKVLFRLRRTIGQGGLRMNRLWACHL